MKKKSYLYQYIKEDDKTYYSLNFLFAKLLSTSKEDKKILEKPISTIVQKYKGKNIVVEKYYKNISTIFEIPKTNEDN